jgi:hypothetical protein
LAATTGAAMAIDLAAAAAGLAADASK